MRNVGLEIIDIIGKRHIDNIGRRDVRYILLGNEEYLNLMSSEFYRTSVTHRNDEIYFLYDYPIIKVMKDSFFDII